jgi:membrane protein required for colicin V production
MPFTILDVIVIVVVLISAVLAMVRGLVREVLSVASWVAAVAAAYLFYGSLLPFVRPYFDSNTVSTIVAAGVIFFIALIVASFVTMKIADVVIDSRVGAVDRSLGFFFGAARGILLLVVALLFFKWMVDPLPKWVADAKSRPMLDTLGERLMAALPDDIEAELNKRRGGGGGSGGGTTENPAPEESGDAVPEPDADPGPSNAARQGLNRLIQGGGGGTGN